MWVLAWSPNVSERLQIVMMKTASMSNVAVSFGRRFRKRITPSEDCRDPAMIRSPRTSRAFAKIEPRMVVCATTSSPARSEKSTMKSSGRFPSVDCRTPVTAGLALAPTASVENETIQARPASVIAPTTNVATSSASLKWRNPVTTESAATSATTASSSRESPPMAGDSRSRVGPQNKGPRKAP